jgi:hypothetical protein
MNTLTTELTAMLDEPNTCESKRLHNVWNTKLDAPDRKNAAKAA